ELHPIDKRTRSYTLLTRCCMHRWPAEKADATTHKMEEETLLDQTEWMICHAWSS
ncbi:unnamed protein product, partial [Musa banksii]